MRLFVAIGVPAEIGDALSDLSGTADFAPGMDWIDPETYHITLRFIGDAGRAQAGEIDAALAEIVQPGFELGLAGVDLFRTGARPRVLWAGVQAGPALAQLERKVDAAVVCTGLPPETRRFTPHVTIARLKAVPMAEAMRFVAENSLFRAPTFFVDHFTLYESLQGKGGPVYVPLADYPLANNSLAPPGRGLRRLGET